MADRYLNISVSEGGYEAVRKMAFDEHTSMSAMARTLLKEALIARTKKEKR